MENTKPSHSYKDKGKGKEKRGLKSHFNTLFPYTHGITSQTGSESFLTRLAQLNLAYPL